MSTASNSDGPEPTLSNGDSGNDKAWIAGPIVGSIVGFLALAGLILFLAFRKRNKQRALEAKQAQEAAMAAGATGAASGGAGGGASNGANGANNEGNAVANNAAAGATEGTTGNSTGAGVGAGAGAAGGLAVGGAAAAAAAGRSSTPSSRRESVLARSNSDRSMFRSQSEHSFENQSRNSHDLLSAFAGTGDSSRNNTNGQSNRHSVASPLDELVRSFSVRKARK